MPIDGVFEAEATAAMGKAFDAACTICANAGQSQGLRELIARRIIAAAGSGELDPVRLRTAALSGLSGAAVSPSPTLISPMRVRGGARH
jgi:hypothetical protein